jgi:hypothetical protein
MGSMLSMKQRITITLDKSIMKILEKKKESLGIPMSTAINRALIEYFKIK